MKVTVHFYLRFSSRYGQNLFVVGNTPALGDSVAREALPLQYVHQNLWTGKIEVDAKKAKTLAYSYILEENGKRIREFGNDRFLDLEKGTQSVFDTWSDASELKNTYLTTPFRDIFFRKNKAYKGRYAKNASHEFRVKAPLLKENEVVCLLGSCAALGDWNSEQPKILLTPNRNWHTARVDLSAAHFPIAYKYGVWNTKTKQFAQYESGQNRVLHAKDKTDAYFVVHDGFAHIEVAKWKGAGVAVPIFSLRTTNGLGVGEFTDMPALADWAVSIGLKMLQILPINDTSATDTWTDSYPYASISAFALHPQYLNLEALAGAKHGKVIQHITTQKSLLNEGEVVDYEAVMRLKWEAIELVYAKEKKQFRKEAAYKDFYKKNENWLLPYAAFCFLKKENGTVDFNTWQSHKTYDKAAIEALNTPKNAAYEALGIHLFVQYHLHLQLKAAVDYCHRLGLTVKGDIPIGIYRYSADAWTAPELYNMNQQAGAPPDDFAETGQNWGFPTYDWERMKANDFAWWRQRFDQMSNYFDAFRIDHILGFFRIWSIPMHAVQGILGRFVPAIPVRIHEFYSAGIGFAYDRFCRPYITDAVLVEIFGGEAGAVRHEFLDASYDGTYTFKPGFDTQRKVEAYFSDKKSAERDTAIREGLYKLHANVILIEEPDSEGKSFHFRINIEKTSSFQHLEAHAKARLLALYNDYFYTRQDDFWQQEAMEKLPSLKAATEMLICGEDLGMVPDCVPEVMRDLAMLSLEIQRMPKQTGVRFFHPKNAPYLSVVTPSTHDMSPLRLWWEEEAGIQQFYTEEMQKFGIAPREITPSLAQIIIAQHLWSPAMLAMFQLQDIFAMDKSLWILDKETERINVPANPKHYWRYRMPITIDALQQHSTFNEVFGEMVKQSGRV